MITFKNGWSIMFSDIEIEKHKFHHYKSPILLEVKDTEIFPSDSNKEQIKTKYQDYVFFETAILKINFWDSNFENVFLEEQFWKCIIWGSNFENIFLRKQFWKWIFWENNFDKYYVDCWLDWLLIGMTADWGGCWLGWVLDFGRKVLSLIRLTKKIYAKNWYL